MPKNAEDGRKGAQPVVADYALKGPAEHGEGDWRPGCPDNAGPASGFRPTRRGHSFKCDAIGGRNRNEFRVIVAGSAHASRRR